MPKYFSQTDKRWASKKLGNSSLSIGGYGCAITAIANLHNHLYGTAITPAEMNDSLKKVKAFSGAMVDWTRVPLAYPKLKFVSRDRNYNNVLVSAWIYIFPRVPVIGQVWVNAKWPSHFFLMIGGGKIVDSIDGKIKPSTSYKDYIGSVRYTKSK